MHLDGCHPTDYTLWSMSILQKMGAVKKAWTKKSARDDLKIYRLPMNLPKLQRVLQGQF